MAAVNIAELSNTFLRAHLPESDPRVVALMEQLGVAFHSTGEYTTACNWRQRVLCHHRDVLKSPPRAIATSLEDLAESHKAHGNFGRAAQCQEDALKVYRAFLNHVPGIPQTIDVIRTMTNLAATYSMQGRAHDARSLTSDAVATAKRVLPQEHSYLTTLLRKLTPR